MVSNLGQHHEALAYHMTFRAVLAAVITAVGFSSLAMVASVPFTLFIPPLYVVLELVFAVIYVYRYVLLSYQPIKHRPLSHDPWDAFERAMQHMQQFTDIRHFLSIWFHGAPFEDIKRENVADLIAYAFFYRTRDEVAAEGLSSELESMVACIEHTWGVQLAAGYNPKLRWMCHLWEPMRHWYRPLGFYLFMEFAALIGNTALRAAGFQQSTWMGMTYFMKNMPTEKQQSASRGTRAAAEDHGDSSGDDVPLVLLHGIGMGLIPYISLLFNMAATGRPVLALQLKHVSMRWVLWVPTVDEVAEVLVGVLRREAVHRCCLVAHSYGTAVASRLLQQHPEKILQLCMIDPVCFSMFMPNLLRNFLYESPRTGSLFGDFMMMSAARDLHVAATLSRRFFWTDVNLWEEQLPSGSLVVLSGRDVLMAAAEVKAWLELRTDAVVMFHPELPHAGFLMDVGWQQRMLQQLLPLLDQNVQQQHQEQQDPQASSAGCKAYLHTRAQPQDTTLSVQQSQAICTRHACYEDQQQHRAGSVTPRSPLPHQQRRMRVTDCSSTSDSCSSGSNVELTAFAATAAAIGMLDCPCPHELSRRTASAASVGPRISTGGSSSLHSGTMPVPAGPSSAPVLLYPELTRNVHALSAIAGGGAAVLSSSSSAGSGMDCKDALGAASVAADEAEPIDFSVSDHNCSHMPPASTPAQLCEPLQSWNSLLHSQDAMALTASRVWGRTTNWGSEVPCDAQSVGCTVGSDCSAADCTDSPRTYFSGMSSQSWQDFAQLAHGREAATAAKVLLQPLLALQQRRQQREQQQVHSYSRDGVMLSRQDSQCVDISRAAHGPMPASRPESQLNAGSSCLADGDASALKSVKSAVCGHSSRREGMMRRVEVLLHRRGGRQSRNSTGGDSASHAVWGRGNLAL